MAEENSSSNNTGIVAIVVIFVIVLILGFLAFQGGLFGGGKSADIDVNISAPGGGSGSK